MTIHMTKCFVRTIFIVASACVTLSQPARAGVPAAEIALRQLRQQLAQPGEDIEVSISRASISTTVWSDVNAGVDSLTIQALSTATPRGAYATRVSLFKGGVLLGSGQVTFRVERYRQCLSAARLLTVGEKIVADDVTLQRTNVTEIRGEALRETGQIVGLVCRHNLQPGAIIMAADVVAPYEVSSGDKVRIQYTQGAMTIAAEGSAMQAGRVGESIRVRNTDSKKIITAVVVSQGVVSAAIGG